MRTRTITRKSTSKLPAKRNTRKNYKSTPTLIPYGTKRTSRSKYFRRPSNSINESLLLPYETIVPQTKTKMEKTPSPFENMVLQNSPIENVVELDSNAIHYLVDFAGTDNVIESIIFNYDLNQDPGKKTKIILGSQINGTIKKNILYSKNAGTEATHWVYYDQNGKEHNSYMKEHQPKGSNGFCQSFAILYMLQHTSDKKVFKKMVKKLEPNEFEKNNLIVIQFWKYILKKWFKYEDIKEWCINGWKEINDEKIKDFSETTRVSKVGPMKPLLDDSSKLDEKFILYLIEYLETNYKTITEKINKNTF